MIKKNIDLSLIIPCYNEEPHLEESYHKIINVLKDLKIAYEIILIDDCSSDKTTLMIKKIIDKNHETTSAVFHKSNLGRGGVVNEGIRKAKGEVVGYLDVDLEVSEKYIPRFYNKIKEGYDEAIANRKYKFSIQKLARFFATKIYAALVHFILKSKIKDTEAGYKFFNRKKILPVLDRTKDKHWFWDTEIVMRSLYANLKIAEIPVEFIRNPQKKSTVKIIPDSIEYLKKLIKFKYYESNKRSWF